MPDRLKTALPWIPALLVVLLIAGLAGAGGVLRAAVALAVAAALVASADAAVARWPTLEAEPETLRRDVLAA